MYKYVSKSELKKYLPICSDSLNQLKNILKKENIVIKIILVGSGARKIVTQNEKEPFDADYNILIEKSPDELSPKELKNKIRIELDKILTKNSNFKNGEDSTSAITYKYFENEKLVFSFDIAILKKNEKTNKRSRLIHKKETDEFVFEEVREDLDVSAKVKFIKDKNKWDLVKEKYLNKKNEYLSSQDEYHPSFIIYVVSVNEVYDKLTKKSTSLNKNQNATNLTIEDFFVSKILGIPIIRRPKRINRLQNFINSMLNARKIKKEIQKLTDEQKSKIADIVIEKLENHFTKSKIKNCKKITWQK